MTLISSALAQSFYALRRVAGVSVTFTRPSTGHSVTLTAVPGSTGHEVERDGQVIDEVQSRDYLVLASELVLNGAQITPDRHDTITEAGTVHKVLNVGGEAQWRYSDPQKTIIRIHTKAT